MENEQSKKVEEGLSEVYRNAQLALQSISDIMPQVDDLKVREELSYQHEEYEKISAKASMLAKNMGTELKEPNFMKKAMMWGAIKMSTLTDNSPAHIADKMIQGTVMGITALRKSASELPTSDEDETGVVKLLEEMVAMEETFEKRWKDFL